MVTIADAIAALCEIFGQSIVSYLLPIIAELKAYLEPPHPKNDSIVSIGAFADIFKFIPSTIEQYGPNILPACLSSISSSDDLDTIRNTAFCIGMAIEGRPDLFKSRAAQICEVLANKVATA